MLGLCTRKQKTFHFYVTCCSDEKFCRCSYSQMSDGFDVWRCQNLDENKSMIYNSVLFGIISKQVNKFFDNNRLNMKKICLNMFLLFFTILQNDCNGQFLSEKMFWLDSMKSKDLLQHFIPSMGETGPSQTNSRVWNIVIVNNVSFLKLILKSW